MLYRISANYVYVCVCLHMHVHDGKLHSILHPHILYSLEWRHNEGDVVSNQRRLNCLHNRLFRRRLNEKPNAPPHWPLWGDFSDLRWIRRKKGQ